MFIWLYRLAFIPCFLVFFPLFLPKLIRRGSYFTHIRHRFGQYRHMPKKICGRRRIWIQVVSVGEAQAAMSLIQSLLQRDDCDLCITTTTTTAFSVLSKKLVDCEHVWIGFFPFDFFPFVKRAWRTINPDLIVLFESELWPEHLFQARCHQVPVWLVNARHSQSSMSWYRRFPYLLRWLYSLLDTVLCVSKQQAEQLQLLAVAPRQMMVMGQMKFDMSIPQLSRHEIISMRHDMGFVDLHDGSLFLMGISTWPGEEEILLNVTSSLRLKGLDVRLILIPRHAERGQEILSIVKNFNLPWSRRSTGQSVPGSIVHIADTTGEVHALCQCAHLGLIGKSFSPHRGGQTPLELAACGIPMVYGPHMSNFIEICEDLESRNLVTVCQDAQDAQQILMELLCDIDYLDSQRCQLQLWAQGQRGALSVVEKKIDEFFA